MIAEPESTASGGAKSTTISLWAEDVTGMHAMEAPDVPNTMPAGAVARTIAARMGLPANVPWTLRDDRSGNYIQDDLEIAKAIEPGSTVTVTPKSHLG